jgi:hypothetical protein
MDCNSKHCANPPGIVHKNGTTSVWHSWRQKNTIRRPQTFAQELAASVSLYQALCSSRSILDDLFAKELELCCVRRFGGSHQCLIVPLLFFSTDIMPPSASVFIFASGPDQFIDLCSNTKTNQNMVHSFFLLNPTPHLSKAARGGFGVSFFSNFL